MKKFLSIFFLLISFVGSAQKLDDVVKSRPSPAKLVNDYTNTLTAEQVSALESKLVAYDKSTTTQIAVVIVSKLDGNSIDDAAFNILRDWGVGSAKNNNGVVILVAKDDRKVGIQVGYGLEKVMTDLFSKSIIDNDITPNFKQGNYYQGLNLATDDVIKVSAGTYQAPEGYGVKKSGKGIGFGALFIILMIILAVAGRGGGRGGGGMVSRRGYGDIGTGWLLGSLLGGGGSGGGWSGGGGGGGGGGFGGFGGGSGGGGGASGSW